MYVTRPLSHYKNNSDALSLPPEGPNSGYLVIQDEESVMKSCFGSSKYPDLIHLPFPQNKNLTTRFSLGADSTDYHNLAFFPVLNQPLSKNRYYVIAAHGKHKGKAYACSKEEDMTTCCFCSHVNDVKPRAFDPCDIYQQFKVANYVTKGSFYAKSVARGAFPPYFLSTRGWKISTKTPKNYKLGEALGLDSTLRARLPDLSFSLSHDSSETVLVGRWYCPFMFIKDGRLTSSEQMEKSMFYEMTLEQRWELIFEHENIDCGNVVMVDAVVQTEAVSIRGTNAVWNENHMVNRSCKTKWFRGPWSRREVSIGLSSEIYERMKWEEERVGWVGGGEREVRVERVEEFKGGVEGWRRFQCYVLVERFLLKRMDGSSVMTYDFKHTQQLKCMWV